MIVSSERTAAVGIHVTPETKETLKQEAARRNMSMSALAAKLLVEGLDAAGLEEIQERSNKRFVDKEPGIALRLVDKFVVPVSFSRLAEGGIVELLPAIPGHSHTFGDDGEPTCGCKFKPQYRDVPLPLEAK